VPPGIAAAGTVNAIEISSSHLRLRSVLKRLVLQCIQGLGIQSIGSRINALEIAGIHRRSCPLTQVLLKYVFDKRRARKL